MIPAESPGLCLNMAVPFKTFERHLSGDETTSFGAFVPRFSTKRAKWSHLDALIPKGPGTTLTTTTVRACTYEIQYESSKVKTLAEASIFVLGKMSASQPFKNNPKKAVQEAQVLFINKPH